MEERINEVTDKWMDGRVDGWMDSCVDDLKDK